MGKLEKYTSYKESGVEWLGEIPEHWEIKKLKFIANNKTIKSVESDFKIALENIESQTTKYIETQEIVFSEAGINFKKGDVLFGKLRPYLAKVYLAEKDGLCVNEFLVLESKKIKSIFLKYMLVSYFCIEHINSSTYGTKMPRASWNFIGNSLIPLPSQDEQTKIASFLDEKTTQIDKAISQKEKLIELLKGRRQITINEAVTKGLAKDVELKDSGVEWIGEIPKHWEVSKLGTCLKPISIKNRPDLPLLSVTREQGVILRDVDDKDSNHNFIPDDLSGYKMVEKGQFAMNKMKAWQGSYGISDYTGIVSPAYYIFELNRIEPHFFHKAIRSSVYVPFFIKASDGVRIGQWDLSKSRMKEIPFYIPSTKDEQMKIVEYIEIQTAKIDKAIELQQNYIAKLKEYKASLIDSVVTGKVRV
ncbi:restriction endonuclease subunit S [Sulfurimonas sp.]|uniref:restriction endonuclease subunit S n=1 Tax=Sulfurimonas sp. TaxID=2022749 RepID=UPI0025DCCA4A|nr:restriction endonuclease subunit S [Sulfurimonas sp.]MCK9454842.1 restriction endonuclease subunit S [Sulfurimonas sp.]